ncbi:MAG TPA: DUF2934 domain-containing protein [Steroidobacteraceae bacterium]|nr:DUF2934 domain-containing protein [Steroidobacteraceae bacterium]
MSTPQDTQRIRTLAYHIWEQEGRPDGRAAEHWSQAEKQLEVEFRVGFPDATGNEDPDSDLASDAQFDGGPREPAPRGRSPQFRQPH